MAPGRRALRLAMLRRLPRRASWIPSLWSIGHRCPRLDLQSSAFRVHAEPPSDIFGWQQSGPVDLLPVADLVPQEERETPLLLVSWTYADPDAATDVWRRSVESVFLRNEAIAPKAQSAAFLDAVHFSTDPKFETIPVFSLVQVQRASTRLVRETRDVHLANAAHHGGHTQIDAIQTPGRCQLRIGVSSRFGRWREWGPVAMNSQASRCRKRGARGTAQRRWRSGWRDGSGGRPDTDRQAMCRTACTR